MLRDVQAAEAAVDNETPRASLGADLLIASLRMAYSHARQPDALTDAARHVLKVIDQLSRHQVPAPGAVPGDRHDKPGFRSALGR